MKILVSFNLASDLATHSTVSFCTYSCSSELVQLKLNIESSVTKASSGGFRRSRTSQKEFLAAKSESTPT
ncbi:MAG: hypothetical protein WA125_07720, partial [Desulfosporosinus sp.]